MAWVRIHDGAMQNLKILRLPDSAFRLWVTGLCYCQTALTDGLIPREALGSLSAKRKDIETLTTPQVADRAPLWETIDGFGYKVHDYLAWNDCREKVRDRQAEAKVRRDAYEARKKAAKDASAGRVRNASEDASRPDASRRHASITKPNQIEEEKKELKNTHVTRARERFGPTLMGNEHRAHAACGRVCVPAFLHRQFKDSLGGDESLADTTLRDWYSRVFNALPEEGAVPSDATKFWRPLFDAEFVTERVTPPRDYDAEVRRDADAMRDLLKQQGHL